MSSLSAIKNQNQSNLESWLIAALFGALSGIGLLVVFTIITQIWFVGRIFPGVTISGIEIGKLSPQNAAAQIHEEFKYPSQGRILLKDGENTWLVSPGQLGLFFDPESTVQKAYEIGRTGNIFERLDTQWSTWRYGYDITPVFVFDERITYAQLQQIALQIDTPVVEAQLAINGTEVIANNGQIGRTVQLNQTIAQIEAYLPSMQDGIIDLVVEDTPPYILDTSTEADLLRQILSEPLVLVAQDEKGESMGGPWQFEADQVAEMININRVLDGDTVKLQIGFDAQKIRDDLNSIAPDLYVSAKDARYIFNDETGQLEVIENAVIGKTLDIENSLANIQKTFLKEGNHQVPLAFIINKPQLTDETTGAELGITELIHEESSYFYGSSADRVQNISVAAAEFHGVMVPPHSTFSMASVMDDITLDNGYAEALIIAGGRTIEGVGGGVCQVSTTLFRAAFFAGFPIEERHSHAYRVSYYEKTAGNYRDASLAGLDATVYIPVVDLKFTNDTDYWILMETYVNPTYSSIIWKFYSTSDGRQVDWSTTGPYNLEEPPEPKYVENGDLSEGQIKQVDWAAQGADVDVKRTVTRNGETLFSDSFFTHYRPWQAVYEYGPGTELPNPDSEDGE